MDEVKFFFFGDSICFGQLINPNQIWINAFAGSLARLSGNNNKYLVQNAAVNGNTTRLALERLSYDITSHSPKYVYVQFGMNDCNYWDTDNGNARVSECAFSANLIEIVQKCLSAGTAHCFVANNHPSLKNIECSNRIRSYDENNAYYSALVKETAQKMIDEGLPISFIDVRNLWEQFLTNNAHVHLSDLLLSDGIHLSSQGHGVYMEYVGDQLLQVIRKLEES